MGQYEFWKWEKTIPKEICELLKKEFKEYTLQEAKISKGTGIVDKKTRNSNVFFVSNNHWIEGILLNYARYANHSAGWNFYIDNIENVQLTKYEKGQFYDWHADDIIITENNYNRKLSVVLLLSDPSEYEGGGLYLKKYPDNLLQNQGDIVVFPSFLEHKAAEVTSGVRMTAVGWVCGPLFK